MKKLAILAMTATLLNMTACANNSQNSTENQMVGMANPASEFCVKQGGKSEIRKNADGSEYGVCIFPNGQVVDEWDYFRANSK